MNKLGGRCSSYKARSSYHKFGQYRPLLRRVMPVCLLPADAQRNLLLPRRQKLGSRVLRKRVSQVLRDIPQLQGLYGQDTNAAVIYLQQAFANHPAQPSDAHLPMGTPENTALMLEFLTKVQAGQETDEIWFRRNLNYPMIFLSAVVIGKQSRSRLLLLSVWAEQRGESRCCPRMR